eukprot:3439277-Rhodomonas_salina.1
MKGSAPGLTSPLHTLARTLQPTHTGGAIATSRTATSRHGPIAARHRTQPHQMAWSYSLVLLGI